MTRFLKIEQQYRRTIVVGDIHGCLDEFRQLLEALEFRADDLVVHVGDMIDRGPQSWRVAEFFRDTPNAYSALGNHERRLAGSVRGTSLPAWSQLQTLSQIGQECWSEWAEYFESLSAVIETKHAIVTHARIDPNRPLDDQDPFFTCAVGGPSVVIQLDQGGIPTWFRDTNFDKPICIGHIGYNRVELVERKLYALDEGAVKGGKLTAVVFPEGKVVSIPAANDYYSEARQQWTQQETHANKKINEWRIQIALPRSEPAAWPLKFICTLLALEEPVETAAIVEAIQKVESTIEDLRFNDRIKTVKRELADQFGPLPERGPERGGYIQKLRTQFGKLGAIAAKLADSEIDTVMELAQAMKHKGSLGEAYCRLGRLIGDPHDQRQSGCLSLHPPPHY